MKFIGVIHLPALPGSPRFAGDMDAIVASAVADAQAYLEGGADAVIVENFGDIPFTRGAVPPVTIAAMAVAGQAVRQTIGDLPLGFNVLRNDASAALGLCAACGGDFVRVNVLNGAAVTDQGIIEGDAFEVVRLRESLCARVQIFADVHVKHAAPLGEPDIGLAAVDTIERGLADALIISGTGTGASVDLADLRRVRESCPHASIFIGSGANAENATALLEVADGLIAGSSLKHGGILRNPVEADRVRKLRAAIDG